MYFYNKLYNDCKDIIYSIVIPVFNQEDIIIDNLKSIIHNTINNFEIIIILDYCFDNTEKKLLDFLENYKNSKDDFIQIKIYKNELIPLFETKCDNIGFKNSIGKYCLEIQADMKMTEMAYNLHLTKPFLLYDNVIAVSGRCAHNLFLRGGIGKLGRNIEKNITDLNLNKNKFYVYETCNRGPLLLDRKKLEELNFLNEDEYFLDNSDHDLMARAYLKKNYICGYVPIDFDAPLILGSMRNTKTYNFSKEYFINKNEKERLLNKYSKCLGLNKYKNIWKYKQPLEYDI
jgi:glycosyltransferase involved in cell wall biosynthesis